LCEIPNIGKVRAEKLWEANIRTAEDVANNPDKVKKVLNLKDDKIKQICDDAKLAISS
jgi:replicative superfamily II helicase